MLVRPLSAAEEGFLRSFFERVTAAGIRWLLMRNYEGFPSQVGNDIVLVSEVMEIARPVERRQHRH